LSRFQQLIRIGVFGLAGAVALPNLASASTAFGSDFQLNGSAAVQDGALNLTPGALQGEVGSAFLTTPIAWTASTDFSVAFQFRIVGGDGSNGADGFTFALASGSDARYRLGVGGGNLGFSMPSAVLFGTTPMDSPPAFAVGFDTFQNAGPVYGDVDGNHVGTLLSIAYAPRVASPAAWDLNSGDVYHAWIDYRSADNRLAVFLSPTDVKPDAPMLTDTIDLYGWLGPSITPGFTAATGGLTNEHLITGFALSVLAPVPEPGAAGLMAAGLAVIGMGMGMGGRRRQAGRRPNR
jgi:hypothetical protein